MMTKQTKVFYKQQIDNDLLQLEVYLHQESFDQACFLVERMIVSSKAFSDDALSMSLKQLLMEVELYELAIAKHHLKSIIKYRKG